MMMSISNKALQGSVAAKSPSFPSQFKANQVHFIGQGLYSNCNFKTHP